MDERKRPSELTVSFIDRDHRAVYMEYEGCSISLAFSKEANDGIRDTLKDILIGTMVSNSGQSQNCVSV